MDENGQPKVVSFRLPSLAQASIYHEVTNIMSHVSREVCESVCDYLNGSVTLGIVHCARCVHILCNWGVDSSLVFM